MEAIVVGTYLVKSASVNARVIKKPLWGDRNGTLHGIFVLKANGMQLWLNSKICQQRLHCMQGFEETTDDRTG